MPGRIFCAIDTPDPKSARALVDATRRAVDGIKLGLEFFTANGPQGVRAVGGKQPVFLDLKLHDIPNTVAAAIRAVSPLKPAFVTIHASGGPDMLKAASDAADGMKLLGITVLTSLDEQDLAAVGQSGPVEAQVKRLADLAQKSGLAGVVCSAREVAALRAQCGPDFLLVVPGIRLAASPVQDQKRTATPAGAAEGGADILVVGRAITAAPDPAAAARAIRAAMTR